MCGIVGYIGKKRAVPILLEGMRKLEYRGYDSAGIAVRGADGNIAVVKACGKLANLEARVEQGAPLEGGCGVGHTRWATHGEPTEANAHPHRSMRGAVTVVHNGILENYREMREELRAKGYTFLSDTDTEVAADFLEDLLLQGLSPLRAISRFMHTARGSYALAILFEGHGTIFLARKDSPLVVGKGEGEMFIASDVPAFLSRTKEFYCMGNMQMAEVSAEGAAFYDAEGVPASCERILETGDGAAAEKEGFEHFMIKEIGEEPRAVENTLHAYLKDGKPDFSEIGLTGEFLRADEVVAVACGSAYHAAVVFQYVAEKLARVPVRTELASEFRYRDPILKKNTLVVAVSQSGETADTLAALREAKARGAKTVAVVNVRGSSAAREADFPLYTCAGPEIAVATTKAYGAQLAAGYLLALGMAHAWGRLSDSELSRYTEELLALPAKMESVLSRAEEVRTFAKAHASVRDVFMIGRGIDYAVCLEGALKLKEVAYVHTEAYAAGELKHGAISLIENGVLVVGVLTQSGVAAKTRSNLEETKARGGKAVTVSFAEEGEEGGFLLPPVEELFAASLSVLPLQLFAYYVGVERGLDTDKPRNLAKSVTVE